MNEVSESRTKSVHQIGIEWRTIESQRPDGQLNRILQPLSEHYPLATDQEQRLLQVIETLHATVQSYHIEMGTLLRHIQAQKNLHAVAEAARGVVESYHWNSKSGRPAYSAPPIPEDKLFALVKAVLALSDAPPAIEPITIEEFVRREGPNWEGVEPLEFVRQMRGDPASDIAAAQPYQPRVYEWVLACFGQEIAADKTERAHRFLEESLELVQALGCSKAEAQQLLDYVYGRPDGEPAQEVGGVMVTLAALCASHSLDMMEAGETELARVWTKLEQIRTKQASKPLSSPLPGVVPQPHPYVDGQCVACGAREDDSGATTYCSPEQMMQRQAAVDQLSKPMQTPAEEA